ncbi:DUF2461 domain-containing protein [Rhodococcus maanshanensis]|uniref:TIGR02453 family protein n=1 Tax=Rhodococcus maanshanensis TaxID=183556 RepID=A0A1H7MLH5_9NOCA|nr:DUF2461 domain-containing protein [Rhodococcus maanshanensis]SEL11545.1 TIGR02453 family protein [Rhodococcus maanshanensis]
MTAFSGFPVAALDFYEDLEADNSKSWWTAHKAVYDETVHAPMAALLAELEPDFGPGKVFRPYRDVRFSKDKSPYKTHQGGFCAVRPGLGYYVQLDARGLFVAGGFYQADPDRVARFRAAIDSDLRGGQLETITRDLEAAKFEIGGDRLKTTPRGFSVEHPRIELLRHKTLTASRLYASPKWIDSRRTATEVRKAWESMRPLVEWATDVVGAPA